MPHTSGAEPATRACRDRAHKRRNSSPFRRLRPNSLTGASTPTPPGEHQACAGANTPLQPFAACEQRVGTHPELATTEALAQVEAGTPFASLNTGHSRGVGANERDRSTEGTEGRGRASRAGARRREGRGESFSTRCPPLRRWRWVPTQIGRSQLLVRGGHLIAPNTFGPPRRCRCEPFRPPKSTRWRKPFLPYRVRAPESTPIPFQLQLHRA